MFANKHAQETNHAAQSQTSWATGKWEAKSLFLPPSFHKKKNQPHHLQKQTQNSWYILNLQASGLRVTEPMNDKGLSEQDGTRE